MVDAVTAEAPGNIGPQYLIVAVFNGVIGHVLVVHAPGLDDGTANPTRDTQV